MSYKTEQSLARPNGRQTKRPSLHWIPAILTMLSGIAYVVYAFPALLQGVAFSEDLFGSINTCFPIYLGIVNILCGIVWLARKRSPHGFGWILFALVSCAAFTAHAVAHILTSPESRKAITNIEDTIGIAITALCVMLTLLPAIAACFFPLYLLFRRSAIRAAGVTIMILSTLLIAGVDVALMVLQYTDSSIFTVNLIDPLLCTVALTFSYFSVSWEEYSDEDEEETEIPLSPPNDDSDMKIVI